MNLNRASLFGGVVLIGTGALVLAQQMGWIERSTPLLWMSVFALLALVALINYGLSGWKQWPWLFPAGVFGGLAVTVGLAEAGVNSAAVGSSLFLGLMVPFAAVFLMDRSRNWWALIPGGIMLFLALTTLLVDSLGGEWIGALLLFMIAAAFLVVYLMNTQRVWALIVAYVIAVVGIAPLMAAGGNLAAYYGPLFLFAVALPFFVLYFRSGERWWALIPAGALTIVALIAWLAIGGYIRSGSDGALVNALLMGGLAITFGVLWLRHGKGWARIVTLVLALLAAGSFFFASYYRAFWPVAIILVGAYLLFTALRKSPVKQDPNQP